MDVCAKSNLWEEEWYFQNWAGLEKCGLEAADSQCNQLIRGHLLIAHHHTSLAHVCGDWCDGGLAFSCVFHFLIVYVVIFMTWLYDILSRSGLFVVGLVCFFESSSSLKNWRDEPISRQDRTNKGRTLHHCVTSWLFCTSTTTGNPFLHTTPCCGLWAGVFVVGLVFF